MKHPNLEQQRLQDILFLEHINKRLKSNGCQALYTACMIGQCLSELKQIYHGNKKLDICHQTFVYNKLCVLFR